MIIGLQPTCRIAAANAHLPADGDNATSLEVSCDAKMELAASMSRHSILSNNTVEKSLH